MPADRQQQKSRRLAKPASLSSLLLVRDNAPSPSGFVIPFDDLRDRREPDPATGLDRVEPSESPVTKAGEKNQDPVETAQAPSASDRTREAQKLVRALREGDLHKAERLFAELCRLPPHVARRVFYGLNGHDLAIACRALGLDQLLFVSILILSRKLGENDPDSQPEQLAAAIEIYEQHRPTAARERLDLWRQDGFAPST